MSEKPLVLIEQAIGLTVDYEVLHGDVDVIWIDWSEITPDHDGYSEEQLDRLLESMKDIKRLAPERQAAYLQYMADFLEEFFDKNTGYTINDEFRQRGLRTLRRIKHRIVELTTDE